jgi:hypothetical protein
MPRMPGAKMRLAAAAAIAMNPIPARTKICGRVKRGPLLIGEGISAICSSIERSKQT